MAESKDLQRWARERAPDRRTASGDCLSRQELAELFATMDGPGTIAAFAAFDDAWQMFRFVLWRAEEAGDWSLRARILSNVSCQFLWCGDSDTALTCIELALVRADRLAAPERARLHTARAVVLATLGRVQEAVTAVGVADEQLSQARPASGRVSATSIIPQRLR